MRDFGGFYNLLGETTNKVAETTNKVSKKTNEAEETTNKVGFKSAKTRKEARKEDYKAKRKEAREAITAEKRGSDARKEKRFAASKLAREERKARANDRKQAWAEKQVAKGKFENKEAAIARFDALRQITTKSAEIRDNIVNSRPTESIESEEQTQDNVNDTTYIPPMPVVDNKKIGSNITDNIGSY